MFKTRKWATAAAFIVAGGLIIPQAVAAPNTTQSDHFRHDVWIGSAYFSRTTKKFLFCAVDAIYESGTSLGFLRDNAGLTIVLANKAWNLNSDDTYRVTLDVDSEWREDATALPRKSTQANTWLVTIPIKDTPTAYSKLRSGHALHIKTANDEFKYDLKGTSVALRKLNDCYRKNRVARDTASKSSPYNPFKPRTPNPPSNYAARPFEKKVASPPQTGIPTTRGKTAPNSFSDVTRWSTQAMEIATAIYSAINFISQADDIGREYVDGSLSKDYAQRQSVSLIYQAQSALKSAETKIRALPPAPYFQQQPTLNADTRNFLNQLYSQATAMLADSKQGLMAAFDGEKSTRDALFAKQVSRYVILLKTENLQFDLRNARISNENPQFYLNKSMKNGNTALAHVFEWMLEVLKSGALPESDSTIYLAFQALDDMGKAIENGLILNLNFWKKYDGFLKNRPSLGDKVNRLVANMKEAFAVESEIRNGISILAKDLNDGTAHPEKFQSATIMQEWELNSLEIDRLVGQRMDLAKERLRILSELKL